MKNRILIGIFFFLFLLTASGVFAAMVENSRQGSLAISVTSQPGSTENAAETHQGLTCVILNPVSVGAFISKDPIGFNGGFNLYRYADNNPVRWLDSFGLILTASSVDYGFFAGLPKTVGGQIKFNWQLATPDPCLASQTLAVVQWINVNISNPLSTTRYGNSEAQYDTGGKWLVDSEDKNPIYGSNSSTIFKAGTEKNWQDTPRVPLTFLDYPFSYRGQFKTTVLYFDKLSKFLPEGAEALNFESSLYMNDPSIVVDSKSWEVNFDVLDRKTMRANGVIIRRN